MLKINLDAWHGIFTRSFREKRRHVRMPQIIALPDKDGLQSVDLPLSAKFTMPVASASHIWNESPEAMTT